MRSLLKSNPLLPLNHFISHKEQHMYTDPNHLRDKATKVRLDEVADDLLTAMARFHRTQKAVLARDLLERALNQMMEELNAKTDVA